MFKNKQKNLKLYPLLFKVKLPPYSPDINVIELVWAEMKRFLRKKNLKTKEEIADRVELFYRTELTVEKCRSYIGHVNNVNMVQKIKKISIILVLFKSLN